MNLKTTLLTATLGLTMTAFSAQAKAQTPPTFATLDARVDALQSVVENLQKQLAPCQETKAAQAATIAALQKQVELIAANPVLAIGPFVTVNPDPENGFVRPSISFHGANILIDSGS